MPARQPAKVPNPAVRAVANLVGGVPRLAKILRTAETTIYEWENGRRPVPPLRAIEMDEAVGGAVMCERINPGAASLYAYLRKAGLGSNQVVAPPPSAQPVEVAQ